MAVGGGRLTGGFPALADIRERTRQGVRALDDTYQRILNPHVYKVSLSERLKDLKFSLIAEYEREAARS